MHSEVNGSVPSDEGGPEGAGDAPVEQKRTVEDPVEEPAEKADAAEAAEAQEGEAPAEARPAEQVEAPEAAESAEETAAAEPAEETAEAEPAEATEAAGQAEAPAEAEAAEDATERQPGLEAKMQAEAEAKRQADLEARRQREAERLLELRTVLEAERQAEQAARQRAAAAEAEAERRAELEAKRRAELEAERQAEQRAAQQLSVEQGAERAAVEPQPRREEAAEPRSAGPSEAPAPREAVAELSGDLRRSRSGAVRVLLLITGLALLKWLVRGLGGLLGYRHHTTLRLNAWSLELFGERHFIGISLGKTRQVIPLSAVQRVHLVARSGAWSLFAAVVALALAGAVGATLVLWGISGREASWIGLGLVIIGLGVVLDALAYLWVRWCRSRGLADVEIRATGGRLRLCRAPLRSAERLVSRLARG